MPAHKLVTDAQQRLLLNCLRENPALIVGLVSGQAGPLKRHQLLEAWTSIATQLNAIESGATKTPSKWRDYWNERKCGVKKKALLWKDAAKTGAPPKASKLTDIDEEIIELIRKVPASSELSIKFPICKSSSSQLPQTNSPSRLSSASATNPESPQATLPQATLLQATLPQQTPPLQLSETTLNVNTQQHNGTSIENMPVFVQLPLQSGTDTESQLLGVQAAMASAIERLATAAEANTSAIERLAAAAEVNTELLRLLLREFMGRQE